MHLTRIGILAILWILASSRLDAQDTPLLLKEVISREFSIHVGGVQTPEHKQIISRELSVFVGAEPEPAFRQVISRELSLVVKTPPVPARVAQLAVSPSPTGETIALSWESYNEWAELDVARYDVYVSTHPFTNISSMTRYATVPAETRSLVLDGFPAWQDRFFAVVAVDAAGGFDPVVTYAAAYPLAREVVSREMSVFVGGEPEPPFKQVISREVSVVVHTPAVPARVTQLVATPTPSGETTTLSWAGYNEWAEQDVVRYDIYMSTRGFTNVSEMQRYASVPGETFTVTLDGFVPWQDLCFAVVPVDAAGGFDPVVNYAAAYTIAKEVVSREMSVFVGGEPEPPYQQIASREVSLVVGTTDIPAPVTGVDSGFAASMSAAAYGAIDMDWSSYNEYAQADVVRYRVYAGPTYFDDVSAMEPYAYVPAEQTHWTLTGLNPLGIYHLAVVAEDSLGQWNPAVRSFSAQASIGALGEARNLAVTSDTNALHFSWVPPDGADPFLSHYRVYFGGAIAPVTVDRSATVYDATDLQPSHGYPFRIATVDKFGKESEGASLLAATLLDQPTNLAVQGLDGIVRLSWNHVEPNELVYKYAVYVSATNFASVSNLTPVLLTRAHTADVPGLTNAVTYFFAVTTINLCGGERKDVQAMSTAPQPVPGHFADLVITNVESLTDSLYPGHSASFGWRVFNAGAASTSSKDGQSVSGWMDRIILSRDDVLGDADDVTVANIPHTGALALSQAYQTNVTVQIPRIAPGEYFVFIATDADDQVYELLDQGANAAAAQSKLKLRLTVPLPEVAVAELKQLTVTNLPAAADVPAAALTFEVASAPTGVAVDAHNGVVAWTPAEDQGPGRYLIAVRVTDNRSPSLVETNAFYVDVSEINRPPTLTPTAFMAVAEGSQLTFTAKGTDADIPAQALTFSLEPGAPNGSSITPGGVFTWTPTKAQAASTNTVSIRVSDGIDSSVGTVSIYVAPLVPKPVQIGRWPLWLGWGNGVQVVGTLAYVAAGTAGLQILDVSDPTKQAWIGEWATSGRAQGVQVVGNVAYVAGGQAGLLAIDVSDPRSPVLLGNLPCYNAKAVHVAGQVAYVADYRDGLMVVDVSEPMHPILMSRYASDPGMAMVRIAGNRAYIANGPAGFRIVDVSNPLSPTLLGAYNTSGYCGAIQVVENKAYVATSFNGLLVLDVSNPRSPALLGTFPCHDAIDVQVVDNVGYVADSVDGMLVVDVTDASHISRLCWGPANGRITSLCVVSNTAYATGEYAGLCVFDVANPLHLRILNDPQPQSVLANDIRVVNGRAYVANTLGGLQVVDVSNPSVPLSLSHTERPAYSVQVAGSYAYVGNQMQVFELPSMDQRSSEAWSLAVTGNVCSVAVAGSLVYVATDIGLQIVDASNPTTPSWLGHYHGRSGIEDVSIVGHLAYLASHDSGLEIIDVSDGRAPVRAGHCATPGAALGLKVVGNLALLACGWAGFQVIDVSDPRVPTRIGSYDTDGFTLGLQVVGDVVYLADKTSMQVVNIRVPSCPVEVGSWDLGTTHTDVRAVEIDGDGAYLANGPFGLAILRLDQHLVLSPIADRVLAEGESLSFTASTADANLQSRHLTFTLGNGAPDGASLTPEGEFIWTPTEAQGPSTNLITIRVSDGVTNAAETFQVIVTEVNSTPSLAVADQSIPELEPLTVALATTDADLPAQALTYALLSGPGGLTLTGNQILWTPTEAQGPATNTVTVKVTDNGIPALSATNTFRVIVTEVNLVPSLAVADQTIPEQQPFALTLAATDADLPAQTLTYTLLTGPSGLSVTGGQILWTPTEAQGPSTNTVTVKVTDNGTPALSATNTFKVIVTEINSAPSLAILDQTIPELLPFTLSLAATDADLPAQTLTYTLLSGPSGLSLAGKQILWTPTEAQGPSTNTVTVKVTDNGTPALSATNTFRIIVTEVNSAPTLAVADQVIEPGQSLQLGLTATDSDLPAQTLTYTLEGVLPDGLSSAGNQLTWTPTEAQRPSTNTITIKVTDDGVPPMSATSTFKLLAKQAEVVRMDAPSYAQNTFSVSVTIAKDKAFVLESSENLTSWTKLQEGTGTGASQTLTDTPVPQNRRYYRIRLSP